MRHGRWESRSSETGNAPEAMTRTEPPAAEQTGPKEDVWVIVSQTALTALFSRPALTSRISRRFINQSKSPGSPVSVESTP